jgi:serine/threonine protein kinase
MKAGHIFTTPSTAEIVIKKEKPQTNSSNLLLVLREYLFGKAIGEKYAQKPEQSPCPKMLTISIERKEANFKTKLIQSKAPGTSLGKLMFNMDVSLTSCTHPDSPLFRGENTLTLRYRVLFAVLSQLLKLHELGIIHNDLNPFNVIVDFEKLSNPTSTPDQIISAVQLIDFGRSVYVHSDTQHQDPLRDRLGGIRFYQSPNQRMNYKKSQLPPEDNIAKIIVPITCRDEIISFGLFMVHILTGELLSWSCESYKVRDEEMLLRDVADTLSKEPLFKGDIALKDTIEGIFTNDPLFQKSAQEIVLFLQGKLSI